MTKRISVLGDGGWGTAMAVVLAGRNHAVTLWGHDPAYLDEMATTRINRKFLPNVSLPESIRFEADLVGVATQADVVVVAIPTPFLRATLKPLTSSDVVTAMTDPLVVSLAKGVEQGSFARPTEIIAEAFSGATIAVLSGPSHAEEVARGLPATVTLAHPDHDRAAMLQEVFITPTLRVYTSTDVVGVELAGALKNVMALAVGICEGLGLGDNARAALMTRGLAEMTRLGVALGGQAETFAGLAGIGDLITTCVSPHGRNRAVGLALAEGRTLEEILANAETVAEGVHTCVSVFELANQRGIDMPIVAALHAILYEGLDPRDAVGRLMSRAPKAEDR